MAAALAVKRLQKELKAFHDKPSLDRIFIRCDDWNMLKMWYVFQGPQGTPYANGWYWGTLSFPENYPLAPPSVQMLTPSGRFATGVNICLSISSFHPENWSPGVGFAAVLEGLINFMGEDAKTVGSLDPLPAIEERRRLASASMTWNKEQHEFRSAFADVDVLMQSGVGPAPSVSREDSSAEMDLAATAPKPKCAGPKAVLPQFLCPLCSKLFLDPVTVPCGHTFCQGCLLAALDSKSARCPTCGEAVISGQAVNILVRSLIEQQYGEALAQRKREAPAVTTAPSRSSDQAAVPAVPQDIRACPLLPVLEVDDLLLPWGKTVLQPHSDECLQTLEHAIRGGRQVAVLPSSCPVQHSTVGCAAEVESVSRSPQGGLIEAVLVGKHRIQLMEELNRNEDGFILCRCERIRDEEIPAHELVSGEGALGVAEAALAMLRDQIRSVGPSGLNAFRQNFGLSPGIEPNSETLEKLSFWLARVLVSDKEQKRQWLHSTDTHARLLDCQAILAGSHGRMVINLPGAGSWMNVGKSALSNWLLLIVPILIMIAARVLGLNT